MSGTVKRIGLVGYGAIGQATLDLIKKDPGLRIEWIIVSPGKEQAVRSQLAERELGYMPEVLAQVPVGNNRPDAVVECAGHGALATHVLPALQQGIPCYVVSIGALSEPGMVEQIEQAARQGNTQVHLLSGAIGGIDALSAARMAGLDSVTYVGRKPPLGSKR